MSKVGRERSIIAVIVLCLVALTLPLAPAALAQPSGLVVNCVDQSGDDAETNPAGQTETYTCTVTRANGGAPANNVFIDVENLNGANDPDNSAAAGTADFDNGCRTGTSGTCEFDLVPTEGESGTANVCFWADEETGNGDNTFNPAGPEVDGGGCTEAASPDDNDGVDVVTKTWSAAPVTATAIDCDDQSGDDAQTNNVGESETYTCLVTGADSGDAGTAPDPVQGVRVDWENLNGANDPDNSAAAGSADGDNGCVSDANGLCTITIVPTESQRGTAEICFWADNDNDNVFDPAGNTATSDGGDCDDEAPATEDADLIDVVSKTWVGVDADQIDCDDASGDDVETNPAGQAEVYTCTATAPDSADAGTERDPVVGLRIDWENLNGANDPDNSSNQSTPDGNDACTTGANGTCTISIAPAENATGTANICFWADNDSDNVFDPNGAGADGGGCNAETPATEDTDLIDVVTKTWAAGPDTLDCDDQSGDDAQTNNLNEPETYTCTATSPDTGDPGNDRDPHAGVRIDWENLNGVNDADNSAAAGTPDGNDACTTSATGTCTVSIAPIEQAAGSANVCFWADTDNDNVFDPAGAVNDGGGCATETPETEDADLIDVVTKTWSGSLARSIDCEPEAVDKEVGTTHTLTCTVRNASGAPVSGVSVTFTEDGVGTFTSPTVATTDASGQVSATTTSDEPGTQTIVGTLTEDLQGNEPNDVDECDRAAGDPAGSSAGDCSDTTTVTWEVRVRCTGDPNAILGTSGDDVITGTEGDDVICTGGGDDVVRGLGGDDLIILGRGNDRAAGGAGNDDILGGAGNDVLYGGIGNDTLRGQGGRDLLYGGPGNDFLLGGGGPDVLRGGPGADTLRGGRGNDTIYGGRGDDGINGGAGRDTCRGGRGNDIARKCERR